MPVLFVSAAAINILAVPMLDRPVWSPNAHEARKIEPGGAIIEIQVAVSPEGRIVQCTAPASTPLNEWACSQATTHARFKPATDVEARPTFGRFEMGFFISGKNGRPAPTGPRLLQNWSIKVNDLPASVRHSAVATIALLVSPDGIVEQCLMRSLGPRVPMEVAFSLEERACPILRERYRAMPVLNDKGAPVSYVQRIMFVFEREK